MCVCIYAIKNHVCKPRKKIVGELLFSVYNDTMVMIYSDDVSGDFTAGSVRETSVFYPAMGLCCTHVPSPAVN